MNLNDTGVYISIDVEADGPIPGKNSMLSLGASAFRPSDWDFNRPAQDNMLDTFYSTITPLEDAFQEAETMEWWALNTEAYATATLNPSPPSEVMSKFREWCAGPDGSTRPTIVGYPVTYDFMFVYWYTVFFTGPNPPFGFQGADMKTLAAVKMGVPYKKAYKRSFPKAWMKGLPKHTHKAVDDAVEQAAMFMNMIKETP